MTSFSAGEAIEQYQIEVESLREQVEKRQASLTESEQARAYEIDIKCKFSSDLTACEKRPLLKLQDEQGIALRGL